MPKHAPATPLPWEVSPPEYEGGVQICGVPLTSRTGPSIYSVDLGDCNGISERDGRYIAHAANAYPHLVEALRQLSASDYTGHGHVLPSRAQVDAARALLRDLGEAE